jgi:aminopeptidase-like protein
MKRIDLGLVITTVGGPGPFGYKRTFDASHPLNGLIEEVFHDAGVPFRVYPFDIHGSDERQYSSQAFRINTATICRDRYYEYANYHTSLDDLSFVNGAQILETLGLYRRLVEKLEARRVYRNAYPHCEVMLSKRGLYPTDGGVQCPELGGRSELDLILWLLFLSDGRRAIAEIARGLEVQQDVLTPYVRRLEQEGLLVHV